MTVLACDLGGTRIKIGIVQASQVLAHAVLPVDSKLGLARCLPTLKAEWLRLLSELSVPADACQGIAVAFPSLMETTTGRVVLEHGKYPDAPTLNLRQWAADEFGLPLAIENDARMALIGEWRAGSGRGVDDLVMITLGTGVGTATVIEGRPLRGCHGQAGVLGGHFSVRYAGRRCTCGNVGCAEAEASTNALSSIAAGLLGTGNPLVTVGSPLDYATVFRQAALGEQQALKLRDHSLQVWSALAVNLVHAYDPELIILGGGILGSADAIVPVIQQYVARYAITPWGRVRVVAGVLGDQAALVAAEWLLQDQLQKEHD